MLDLISARIAMSASAIEIEKAYCWQNENKNAKLCMRC